MDRDLRRNLRRYRFDSFMAKGGSSIFKVLAISFMALLLVLGALRGLFYLAMPHVETHADESDFLGHAFVIFLQLTDPGNMAQDLDSSPAYKIFAIIAGLAGVILLSALIAFITTALDQKLHELKRGRSKVIEEGHTLILGWNEQRIVEIIRELIIANESEDDACVVILADRDKEEMDDALRLRLPQRQSTRIVTRSGKVTILANLDMVSIERSKSVIILADCEDTAGPEEKSASDAKAIQTILATAEKASSHEEFCVVAEIFNPTHRKIVRATFPEHVVTVNTSDVLAKLLVQTSRSVGLSVVYNEILSFDGCEMYFHQAPWGDIAFADLGYRFPDGVPMGIRQADGSLLINPPFDHRLKESDEILILADDDSTIRYQGSPVARPTQKGEPNGHLEQAIERELMLGWNHKAPAIIREFSDYVKAGSTIDVVIKTPTPEQRETIAALNDDLSDIHIGLIEKDCLNLDQLMAIEPFGYDNIIILAGNDRGDGRVDAQQVDSENIVTLLLLRSIFEDHPEESADTKLITEVLDSQNYALVARAGVRDVIISNRLVSMIIAQISESRDIEKVYDDLFQEDGSEIYLKPASLYFNTFPVQATFADLMATAQLRGEICMGVKLKALEGDSSQNNGVQLIPLKDKAFSLGPEDSLVVLAEDES
jgi:hypothetical protein